METQVVRMKKMAVQQRAAFSIHRITYQWMPQKGQMHPHLVSPPGVQI
jgi:hypothetical protein